MNLDLTFRGKYFITGTILCKTGLHIGGSTEGFEIGGVDNTVIRDPITEQPYIPGSSLKGKLRHLLEWSLGENTMADQPYHFTLGEKDKKPTFNPCSCGYCAACVLFGIAPSNDPKTMEVTKEGDALAQLKQDSFAVFAEVNSKTIRIPGPTRLTVRDAFPTDDTLARWKRTLGENVYTELKTENALDRVTAEANPRPVERVPRDSGFGFTMIVDVYNDKDPNLLQHLFTAMSLLEDAALGGGGTRGSGQISFADLKIEFRSVEYYQQGSSIAQQQQKCENLRAALAALDQIKRLQPQPDNHGDQDENISGVPAA